MGITLYAFIYGQVPFYDNNIIGLYSKIRHEEVKFPDSPLIPDQLKDLIRKMLIKDPSKRITLSEIKEHPWVTKDGQCPLPTEEENCHLVEVTEEDVAKVITSIPKLDTLILIKHMLKKHSFQVSSLVVVQLSTKLNFLVWCWIRHIGTGCLNGSKKLYKEFM